MRIDAHQHFWRMSRGDYGWLNASPPAIRRDFLPDDLEPFLGQARMDRTVLVQAAPTTAETDFLLDLTQATPFVVGVVGWADFEAPDAAHRIAELARRPGLLGLRPMIQDLPQLDWMLGERVRPAIEAMIASGLRFDALVKPIHLPVLLTPIGRVISKHWRRSLVLSASSPAWSRRRLTSPPPRISSLMCRPCSTHSDHGD
jgi:L-fuconolactonase